MENGKGIGAGWELSRNDAILFHGGLTGGYRAWMAIVPNQKLGVVVLSNTTNARIYKFGDQLVHMAMGERQSSHPVPANTVEPDTVPDE
jgi:CubicO group peptidase (beta-lactamase class C family)